MQIPDPGHLTSPVPVSGGSRRWRPQESRAVSARPGVGS